MVGLTGSVKLSGYEACQDTFRVVPITKSPILPRAEPERPGGVGMGTILALQALDVGGGDRRGLHGTCLGQFDRLSQHGNRSHLPIAARTQ